MKKTLIAALAVFALTTARSAEAPDDPPTEVVVPASSAEASPPSAKKAKRTATPRSATAAPWLSKLSFERSTPEEVSALFAAQLQRNKPPGGVLPVEDRVEDGRGGQAVRIITARQLLIEGQRYDLTATFGQATVFGSTLRHLVATTHSSRGDMTILRDFKPGEALHEGQPYTELLNRLARELTGGHLPRLLRSRVLGYDGPRPISFEQDHSLANPTCSADAASREDSVPLDLRQLSRYITSPYRAVTTLYQPNRAALPAGQAQPRDVPSAQIVAKTCALASDGSRTVILGSQDSLAKEHSNEWATSLTAKIVLLGFLLFSLTAWPAWVAGFGLGYLLYSNMVLAGLVAAAAGMTALATRPIFAVLRAHLRVSRDKARNST